jgi:cytochrome c-type biogenesis protein CcsB
MASLLLKGATVCYLLAAMYGVARAVWPRTGSDRVAVGALLAALAAHTLALGGRTVEVDGFPVLSLRDGISILGYCVAVGAAFFATVGRIPQAAPLAGALLVVLLAAAMVADPADKMAVTGRSHWLQLHIFLAFLGDALFAVAGLVSLVYLAKERGLKGKRGLTTDGQGIHRLPALDVLDRASLSLLQWGFPPMTLGLITGACYAKQIWGTYWSWDPRILISLVIWLSYGLLLHFRMTFGWRGKKAAVLTLVGVVVTLVAFVGIGLAGIGTHAEGKAL